MDACQPVDPYRGETAPGFHDPQSLSRAAPATGRLIASAATDRAGKAPVAKQINEKEITMTMTLTTASPGRSPLAAILRWIRQPRPARGKPHRARREREQLLAMDERMLKDIGITRSMAIQEARRLPSTWPPFPWV